MTDTEFKKASQELIDTCKKYNFMDCVVCPYSFKMTVKQLTDGWKHYDTFSYSSKQIMQSEYKGLANIVEHWVKVENEPMVKIRILEGKHKGEILLHHESVAKDFVDCEFAEYVD